MQLLFWVNIGALIITGFISAMLLLLAIGAGIKTAVNRCFAVFVISVLAWSMTLLHLQVSFLTGLWNPELIMQTGGMLFAVSGPLLFSFAVRYTGISKRLYTVLVLVGIAALASMAYPMFTGQVVTDPRFAANGTTIVTVKPLAWFYGSMIVVFFAASFGVLWRKRHDTGDLHIVISPLLFLLGTFLDGLLTLPFPYISLCGAAGMALLGRGVMRRQVFNPLKELNYELETQVRKRTIELEQAYAEVEKEVDDRTSELKLEIEVRAETEAELRESEEKFRTFSEQSPNVIFINKRGRIVYVNNRGEELMGYTREEFLSEDFDFRSIIAPESIPTIEGNFAKHMAGEELEPYEYRLVNKWGEKIDAIIHTRLIDFEGEKAILGIVTDISVQKRTERLLQTLSLAALDMERSLDYGDLVPIATTHLSKIGYLPRVYVADEESEVLIFADTINPTAAKLFVDEFPEFKQFLNSRAAVLIRGNDPIYHVIKDGIQLEEVSFNSALLTPLGADSDGKGFVAVLGDDIRENEIPPLSVFASQLAASYRRAALLDELGASIRSLKDAQEELAHAQRMEAIGRLSGGVAHDFNNILTAIHGCAELIDVDLASGNISEVMQYVREIKRAVRQASGLTQQLLTFSRKQVFERRNLELNTVIRNMDNLLRRVIGEDIGFNLELGGNLGLVSVDERQFGQVLMNLAVNARDAMPNGGEITVRTFKRILDDTEASERDFSPGPYCVLTFSDTGIGMDAETRRRVFEPFFTTKEFGKGTGLGMSTVYGIVKQCDGYIVVESEPQRGTTYLIYLPKTGELDFARDTAEDTPPQRVKDKETILVVEDDETVRVMTRKTLERQGYKVLVANDAAVAVEICGRNGLRIDVMLTDIVMPGGMNGFELADWLSRNRPDTKLMFMSGYADEMATPEGVAHHKKAFLKKPFSSRALLETLREVCDGKVYT